MISTLFLEKDSSKKTLELTDIMRSQEKFTEIRKKYFSEQNLKELVKYIRIGSRIFILGLLTFFTSIIYSKLLLLFKCL